jgi:hypothetical protein
LHFPDGFLVRLLAIPFVHPLKTVCFHYPFFDWIIAFFFLIDFVNSLCIPDMNPLSDEYLADSLPFCVLSLHAGDCVLCHAEVFEFDAIPFVNSCPTS